MKKKVYSIYLKNGNVEKLEKLSEKTKIRKSEIFNLLIENLNEKDFVKKVIKI